MLRNLEERSMDWSVEGDREEDVEITAYRKFDQIELIQGDNMLQLDYKQMIDLLNMFDNVVIYCDFTAPAKEKK